jgi:hypothetical protein
MDPLLIISAATMQIGARHLDFDLTPLQKKIIKHKYFQILILFAILYISTKDAVKSVIILIILYICLNILFNENHKYNILSNDTEYNLKKIYYDSLNNIKK